MNTCVVDIPWLLWIMLQWTWKCRYLLKILFTFILDMYPTVGLLDHMVVLLLIFWRNLVLFSKSTMPIYNLTNNVQGFLFLFIFTNACYLIFFLTAILTGVKWCQFGFDLYFPNDLWCWAFYHNCWPFACLLRKNVHVLCPFSNWVIFFYCAVWVPYIIFHINYSSDVWLTNSFSHSIGCLFTLLIVSFLPAKALSLMQSHFFLLVACVLGIISPKIIVLTNVKELFLHVFF